MSAPRYALTVRACGLRTTLRGLTPREVVAVRTFARALFRSDVAEVEIAHGAAVVRERCDGARWRRV